MRIQYTLDDVSGIAQQLLAWAHQCTLFTFTGSLGAGKTTLIRAMLTHMGVSELITSPTYAYVNRYMLPDDTVIYHFDLYRIKTVRDFVDFGFDEYLYARNSLCFIEWPEVIMPLLRTQACCCTIEYGLAQERVLSCVNE
jgi:tRNA threonylcarbamoyladenosine biosynthesis protein TsaE